MLLPQFSKIKAAGEPFMPANPIFIRLKSGETESHKKISEILPLIDFKKSCKFIHVMLRGRGRVISVNRMLGFPEES
jgi:hypothetical protein